MIQRTYDPASEAEFAWLISGLKALDKEKSSSVFVQIFFSRFCMEEARKIMDYLRKELPRIHFAGMSLYGDPIVNLNTGKFLRINICQFDQSDVAVFSYDTAGKNEADCAADFRAKLSALPQAKGVLMLTSGLTFNSSLFIEEASAGFEHIPFFGAMANINTSDSSSIHPYIVSSDRIISTGAVLAVFSGEKLHVYSERLFGWKPIGKPLSVQTAKASGIGDTLVTHIDGEKATAIYKRYLNVDPDQHFISNICEFPLSVERKGWLLPRIPCGFNDSGELNMMGDIKEGETLRFTYGKTDDLLQQSWRASGRMAAFYPQGVFLYVCANRAIFMKDRAHEEIDNFGKIIPGTLYCHGFAELYRYRGKGGVFNSTLVAVGFREGERSGDVQALIKPLPQDLISFTPPEKKRAFTDSSFPLPPSQDTAGHFAPHTAVNPFDFLNSEAHSMFDRPMGTSMPLSDRLVTFLEATTEDLKKATRAANAASEAKSLFLSSMSHEIRTPINAVLGLDEMILRESGEEAIKGYARDIQSSGRSLLSIINDILDFSKIEAGKMEIIAADYDLRALLTDLANMVETRARSKGLDFIVDVDEALPHLLHGDDTRIKQCAVNILTNAVKYTPKGSVTLKVRGKAEESGSILLTFTVEDTGIGIKEEDLPKLFKPFERIEESRNRSIEGTGLGMSIVNGLLTSMGSRLDVQSVYGMGSTFSFTLRQGVRSPEAIGSREEARAALTREATSYTESFQAPDGRILVVDDTPMNLTVIKGLLKTTRLQIDTAGGAQEGLALLAARRYHLAFIDHLMPKMDGIEMLAAYRSGLGGKEKVPCIALTANAVSGAREMYLEAGFEDYLSKPVDPKKLEAMIARYLPPALLLHKGDPGFAESGRREVPGDKAEPAEGAGRFSPADQLFSDIFALDIEAALKNCGSKDVFKEAAAAFYEAIDEKAGQLEGYAADGDWKNYTVLVHALKSSARLIGAGPLSAQAAALEDLGKAAQQAPADSQARQQIADLTPALLASWRAYKARLAPLCPAAEAVPVAAEAAAISPGEFSDALAALREVVSAFDFDSADSIVAQVDTRALPLGEEQRWKRIKAAVRAADQAAVLALL